MPVEVFTVAAEDAPVRVAEILGRRDVARVRLEDVDGEPLVDVPGGGDPEAGARQVLDAFEDYGGGGTTLRLVVQTAAPDETPPKQGFILREPSEDPDESELRRPGGKPEV